MDLNQTVREQDNEKGVFVCVGEQRETGKSPIMMSLIICFLRCSNEGEYYRQDQVQVAETVINTQF